MIVTRGILETKTTDLWSLVNSVGVGRENLERYGDNPEADSMIMRVNALGSAEVCDLWSFVLPFISSFLTLPSWSLIFASSSRWFSLRWRDTEEDKSSFSLPVRVRVGLWTLIFDILIVVNISFPEIPHITSSHQSYLFAQLEELIDCSLASYITRNMKISNDRIEDFTFIFIDLIFDLPGFRVIPGLATYCAAKSVMSFLSEAIDR